MTNTLNLMVVVVGTFPCSQNKPVYTPSVAQEFAADRAMDELALSTDPASLPCLIASMPCAVFA